MTGGGQGQGRCLLHVFLAELLAPAAGDAVSRDGGGDPERFPLVAKAPAQWSSDDYQDRHNRLRYRFLFAPRGLPSDRPLVELLPTREQLRFTRFGDDEVPAVRRAAPLPDNLRVSTRYVLTLCVEDREEPSAASHRVSVPVRILP